MTHGLLLAAWVLGAKGAAKPAPKPAPVEAKAPVEAEPVADDPDLPKAGAAAPSFRLPAYNADAVGPFVSIDTYVGSEREDPKAKVLVVSFMASYCKPCKKEMPYLQQLYSRYKDQGLRVMMVSVDTEDAGFAQVAELIKANGVTFPVLKDRFNIVARQYLGTRTPLPSLFIIGADGNVQQVKRGYNEQASQALLAEVQKAIGVPAEALK